MAGNGTPQSYLNGIIQRNNNGEIRDRAMEQDNTNSGNPYGYLPQLPDQQVPSSYPQNRYIPPTMTGINGMWNNAGLTYSLPTAYNPYGQGGTPYGPQMLQPFMPQFYHGQNGPGPATISQDPSGQQAGAPPVNGGMQPQQAAGGMGYPGVAGATLPHQGQNPQPPVSGGPISPQFRQYNRQPRNDFYMGRVPPPMRQPYNSSMSQASNNLANAVNDMQAQKATGPNLAPLPVILPYS